MSDTKDLAEDLWQRFAPTDLREAIAQCDREGRAWAEVRVDDGHGDQWAIKLTPGGGWSEQTFVPGNIATDDLGNTFQMPDELATDSEYPGEPLKPFSAKLITPRI